MRHLGQEQHVPPDTSGPASLQLATGPAFPRLPEPPPHKYRLPDCLIRVDQRACSSRQARLSPACPNHLHTNTACPIASYEWTSEPAARDRPGFPPLARTTSTQIPLARLPHTSRAKKACEIPRFRGDR